MPSDERLKKSEGVALLDLPEAAQLRARRETRWRSQTAASIEEYNLDVDKRGVFGNKPRGF